MADVCVLGLGYVGLPTASLLANAGFRVLGVDTNREIVSALRSGKCRLEEAGLATLVSAAIHSGNLVAGAAPEPSNAFVICVPTPVTEKHKVDLKAVEGAAQSILPHLKPGNLVVLESTSPIGTTRDVVGKLLSKSGLQPGRDFSLCYCPERVLPGNTVNELINNDRVIGGLTKECAERAKKLYGRFCQGKLSLTDDKTAELCKLMENTSRDVNIALANLFARMAEDAGINAWDAIETASRHPRVKILKPGPGVGGHCIPVDPWFLVESFPAHSALLKVARETNDNQAARLLDRLIKTGALNPGGKLAVLGAAYKADIDDARESPAHFLCATAKEKGFVTQVHDPLVKAGDYHGLAVGNDLAACLSGAAAAVLMAEHKDYRQLTPEFFARHMKGRLIADARNALDHSALRDFGFTVVVLGDGRIFDQAPNRK